MNVNIFKNLLLRKKIICIYNFNHNKERKTMSQLHAQKFILAIITITPFLTSAYAQDNPKDPKKEDYDQKIMERVMVIGSADNLQNIAGAATLIDKEQLEKYSYTDVNRVLRQVPGVNIQEEEGFGNRPNIGIRGGRSERSADITLMEDGVLIAPAPYASPSAYYFPRIARMESIEVRKGSSTIKFGPRTTSGVVNLISSSIPEQEEFNALLGFGSFQTFRSQVHYGNKVDQVGFVLDMGHENSEGFKTLNNGADTGYSIQDIMGKLRFETDETARYYQSIELKVGATQEDSDETYLGLTQNDFNANPFQRYAASQLDNLKTNHQNYMIRHFIDFEDFDLTTTIYHHDFERNWNRLRNVTVGGSTLNLSNALNSTAHLNVLNGSTDVDGSATDNLTFRQNNRRYDSQGIQSDLATEFETGSLKHSLEAGVRLHRDSEDRYQQEDQYAMNNGTVSLISVGQAGSQSNRLSRATAYAGYIYDQISYGDFTFSPGFRYEHIKFNRRDRNSGDIRNNTVDAFVPGIGATYTLDSGTKIFGGIHKGFAPPSPSSTTDDVEESINYEAGIRHKNQYFNTEIVGFFNDYDNLLGECTLSSGCAGATVGDQFNGGQVDAYGIEASLSTDFAPMMNFSETALPFLINYTYTKAEFQNSFTSNFDEWGSVTAGDELPYIPNHQFYVQAGIVEPSWEMNIGAKYVDQMRTVAGSGPIATGEGTDSHFVVDMSGEVDVAKNVRAFVSVNNLFDQEYVAARRPAGARPGQPRTVFGGIKISLY